MPRTADPARRVELIDAIISQLAETGIAGFTLRTLAAGLGRSTRVLTHHFADKEALLTAVLDRLDEQQHEALKATPGWWDPTVSIEKVVRQSWKRHLGADLPTTRLVHEIEGLAAGGRLGIPGFVDGRARFVAGALEVRGMSPRTALIRATVLNTAYMGLMMDRLITGDVERTDAAFEELCALVAGWS